MKKRRKKKSLSTIVYPQPGRSVNFDSHTRNYKLEKKETFPSLQVCRYFRFRLTTNMFGGK